MIIYLPARTLPLGFGDTPVVPPDVIYQDISPFVFWKSFSNFFALHHCLCPPMRPCLFWSQMIMSDLTALLARNFVADLLGHLLAHLPSYWVALLPRYLVSKSYLPSPSQLILDAFFKYSVNQDNQAKRYIRDNQDNQVRLAHL